MSKICLSYPVSNLLQEIDSIPENIEVDFETVKIGVEPFDLHECNCKCA